MRALLAQHFLSSLQQGLVIYRCRACVGAQGGASPVSHGLQRSCSSCTRSYTWHKCHKTLATKAVNQLQAMRSLHFSFYVAVQARSCELALRCVQLQSSNCRQCCMHACLCAAGRATAPPLPSLTGAYEPAPLPSVFIPPPLTLTFALLPNPPWVTLQALLLRSRHRRRLIRHRHLAHQAPVHLPFRSPT